MPVIDSQYLNRILMAVMECMHCGVIYAMSESFKNRRVDDEQAFYCPKGCKSRFGEGEMGRLKRELEQEKNNSRFHQNDADAMRKSRNALRGVVTKTKKRISAGVCPCCNRTFKNVARHMDSKHPEWSKP